MIDPTCQLFRCSFLQSLQGRQEYFYTFIKTQATSIKGGSYIKKIFGIFRLICASDQCHTQHYLICFVHLTDCKPFGAEIPFSSFFLSHSIECVDSAQQIIASSKGGKKSELAHSVQYYFQGMNPYISNRSFHVHSSRITPTSLREKNFTNTKNAPEH